MDRLEFVKCTGESPDFQENCALLDRELNSRVGKKIQQTTYDQYNRSDTIPYALVAYRKGEPVGAAALRPCAYENMEDTVELKRLYVKEEYRRRGIASQLVSELIAWAGALGYRKVVLETGRALTESHRVYRNAGFTEADNFGPYKGMTGSLCMALELTEGNYETK